MGKRGGGQGRACPGSPHKEKGRAGSSPPSRAQSEQEEEEAVVMGLPGWLQPPVQGRGILPALGRSSEAEAPLPLRGAKHLS